MNNNFNIEQFLDLTGYEQSRLDRRKNNKEGKSTQEFFTPYNIVKKMANKIPDADWSNHKKTFCEPCFGNGQFVIYIIWNRLQHGIHWKTALETLWGLELMSDNVAECKDRICEMLTNICEDFKSDKSDSSDFNEDEARLIMDSQLVCHDFFTWCFEEWRPYTEEELHPKKRKKK